MPYAQQLEDAPLALVSTIVSAVRAMLARLR